MNKQVNPYGKDHPYTSVKGAFYSLLSQLPNNVTSSVQYNGKTFAINGRFKYLNFSRGIMRYHPDQVHRQVKEDWSLPHKGQVTLFLPSSFFLNLCGLSVAEAIAGGLHEGGHALCDLGGIDIASQEEFNKYIKPFIVHSPTFYAKMDLSKWVNVIADGRLERGVGMLMPATKFYFFSIQRWVHRLEAEVRGKSLASDFMMALRDSVKGWKDDYSQEVYAEYLEEARDLVEKVRPIWEKVIPTDVNWEETAHLPLSVALEMCNALYDEAQELSQPQGQPDPQEDESGGEGSPSGGSNEEGGDSSSGQGDEEGGEGSSSGSGNVLVEDEEGEEGSSSGSSDEEGDEEEGSSSGSGDEEGDEEGDVKVDKPSSGDENGGEGSSGDENGDDQSGEDSSNSYSRKGSLKIIEDLLNGEGIALNPSSAMDQNIKNTQESLGHRIYVPNGQPTEYRKVILARKRKV